MRNSYETVEAAMLILEALLDNGMPLKRARRLMQRAGVFPTVMDEAIEMGGW